MKFKSESLLWTFGCTCSNNLWLWIILLYTHKSNTNTDRFLFVFLWFLASFWSFALVCLVLLFLPAPFLYSPVSCLCIQSVCCLMFLSGRPVWFTCLFSSDSPCLLVSSLLFYVFCFSLYSLSFSWFVLCFFVALHWSFRVITSYFWDLPFLLVFVFTVLVLFSLYYQARLLFLILFASLCVLAFGFPFTYF